MEVDKLISMLQQLKESRANQLQQQQSLGQVGNAAMAHYDLQLFLKHLKVLDQGDKEAICAMIAQKGKIIGSYTGYEQLKASGDQNNLLGFAFEERMAAKILAASAKAGTPLERIQGDGLGILPNGQKTPQHCDLVFRDKNGRLYSFQMKFSDSQGNLKEMVHRHFKTHGEKTNLSGYPELDVANTDIIVPKGLDKQNIKVKTVGTEKTIQTKAEVQVGDIKVEAPSVDEMKEFLQKNFEPMQKINQSKSELMETNKALSKELLKKRDILSKNQSSTGKANLQSQIAEIEKELANNQKKLSKLDDELPINPKQLSATEVLKGVAIQCVAAAVIAGATTFVISFDQNYKKYKEGKVTH